MVSINPPKEFNDMIETLVTKVGVMLVEESEKLGLPWTAMTAVTIISHLRAVNAQLKVLKDEPEKQAAIRALQVVTLERIIQELKEGK